MFNLLLGLQMQLCNYDGFHTAGLARTTHPIPYHTYRNPIE